MTVEIRRALQGDVAAVARIQVDGWRAGYADIMPTAVLDNLDVTKREKLWQEVIEDGVRPLLVAVSGGEMLGFCCVGATRDDDLDGSEGEVYALYVRPDRWRTGVGHALLVAGAQSVRALGLDTVTLWVLEQNQAARTFYEACGLTLDGGSKGMEIGGVELTEVRYRETEPLGT